MSMRRIYRKVARKHGVTMQEVKAEMQSAITKDYTNPPTDGVTRAYQNRVPRKGRIPTTEEFIRYCARNIKEYDS